MSLVILVLVDNSDEALKEIDKTVRRVLKIN
ncbi:MAG: hypothetical protein MAG551_00606 [Candidatus Scalindua arabica]|uniref:Uncharacterized protein n=1 Tax=Candidatus Scalindua arabica TaxID=1127984 RepID=A0A941W0R4_9BACT|nr:hypothetical protein [Candidatus Scalindua arabica]